MPEKNPNQEPRETNLKGRMAESLVFDLLKESGNSVYKIGYETILHGGNNLSRAFEKHERVAEKMRAIPDFFVIDKTNLPHLVEVKFRWNPKGHTEDISKLSTIRKYWEEANIIFVNCIEKPYFRLSHPPFVKPNKEIILLPLTAFKPFNIPDALVKKFEALVEKYFTPTLTAGTRQKLKK